MISGERELRFLRIILVVLALSSFLPAEEIIPSFAPDFKIICTPPDSKVWKVAAREEQDALGVIMYKRAAIIDENGLSVEPCMSIVYRKVAESVKDPMAFVLASMASIRLEITGTSLLNDGRALVISYKYPVAGCEHTVSIAHLFEVGLGVQVISETTTTVFKNIEADQDAFLRSVSLNKI